MAALTRQKPIIHLDVETFYPAVEVLDNPDLKGKPVIAGGGKERGVVLCASYEARRFGIHSAQPIVTAMRLFAQYPLTLSQNLGKMKAIKSEYWEMYSSLFRNSSFMHVVLTHRRVK